MYLQIHVACGSRSEAEKIAGTLVGERLIACAQISGPVTSVYRWESKVETAEEWMCTMKTVAKHFESIEVKVRELHSYDTPEIIATRIEKGAESYLQWLSDETL